MMERLGRLWTAAIAYVALAIGAGLSIMYNVADTVTQRGPQLDQIDIVTAVAAPTVVVFMVEMFVSKRWAAATDGLKGLMIQVVRWVATLAIGGVAMATSWTHGHDFLAGRGQPDFVATAWPLAIDFLAIMATGLILSGRGHGHVGQTEMATPATLDASGQKVSDEDLANFRAALARSRAMMASPESVASLAKAEEALGGRYDVEEHLGQTLNPILANGHWKDLVATQADDPTIDLKAEMAKWDQWEMGVRGATAEDFQVIEEFANEAKPTKQNVPVVPGQPLPDEVCELMEAWSPEKLSPADFDVLLGSWFGKSPRTVRRWRAEFFGRPTSGA